MRVLQRSLCARTDKKLFLPGPVLEREQVCPDTDGALRAGNHPAERSRAFVHVANAGINNKALCGSEIKGCSILEKERRYIDEMRPEYM